MSPARRYANWISIFNETLRGDLYSQEFVEQLSSEDPVDHLQSAWNRGGNRTAISNAAIADIFTYLPGDLLTKVDICGMAQALEARQPLLDYRLVEFAATLPNQYHYRRGCGKQLLQAACGDLLPREVFARKKQGFGVPLAAWFRGPLRAHIEQLTSATSELSRSGWFQGTTLQSFVNEHLANRFDHSARLWSLIVLEEWLREYHEARK